MQYKVVLEAVGATAFTAWLIRYLILNRRMDQVVSGVEQLHTSAMERLHGTVPPCGIPQPPETVPEDVACEEISGFRFACFVDKTTEGKYVHHIIGMHSGKEAGRLSEAMLLIMRRLVKHFTTCGFEYDVMLHVDVLPSGSQHIDFALHPERETALRAALGLSTETPPG